MAISVRLSRHLLSVSWPGKLVYWDAIPVARESGILLAEHFGALGRKPHKEVHLVLIGHSMGCRVILEAIEQMVQTPGAFENKRIDIFLMAAAVPTSMVKEGARLHRAAKAPGIRMVFYSRIDEALLVFPIGQRLAARSDPEEGLYPAAVARLEWSAGGGLDGPGAQVVWPRGLLAERVDRPDRGPEAPHGGEPRTARRGAWRSPARRHWWRPARRPAHRLAVCLAEGGASAGPSRSVLRPRRALKPSSACASAPARRQLIEATCNTSSVRLRVSRLLHPRVTNVRQLRTTSVSMGALKTRARSKRVCTLKLTA